jgi:hypothetical protein
MMNFIVRLSEGFSKSPLSMGQETALSTSKRRLSGRNIYFAVFAVIAILIIGVTLLIPQGASSIPLKVNYDVGEKMVYDTTMTSVFQYDNSTLPKGITSQLPNSTSIEMQQIIEVTGFDGEYYTLNHTMTMNTNNRPLRPLSFSLIEKMNKTGYSAYLLNLGNTQEEMPNNGVTSSSYLAQLLSKPEVKVGDTLEVPFPAGNSSVGITGDLTMAFKGLQDLTVPAGTYRVIRIDLTSNGLKMNYRSPLSSLNNFVPANITVGLDMNCQMYIEYGTLRQIKTSMQETVSMLSETMSYGMNMNMDMTLVEHIMHS